MGRESKTVEKVFNAGKKNEKKVTVKLFPWEETNAVGAVKAKFGL
jgi:S-adenosylmethionine synthetase